MALDDSATDPPAAVVDVAALRELFGTNTVRLRAVFETLQRDLPKYLTDLEVAAAAADLKAVAQAAHRIAGASGSLGGVRTMTTARRVEQMANDGQPPADWMRTLAADAREFLQALDRLTSGPTPPAALP